MELEGQVALITGAGQGLGAAIAEVLAAAGAQTVLCGRRRERLEAVAEKLQPTPLDLTCDVTDEAQIKAVIERTVSRFGRLDILVNNAGIGDWIALEETETKFFDDVIATNLRGPFLFSKHAWPHLKASKGQILNISSIAGTQSFNRMSAYCASKHGLNGLSGVLAIEGEPYGIRVLSLCPGSVDTDIWKSEASEQERSRMMTPEQLAAFAQFLLTSPRNVLVKQIVVENFLSPFGP